MAELVIVSAADEPSLVGEMARLVSFLDRVPDVSLLDVAYTCSLQKGPCAIALVVRDVSELRSRLSSACTRLESDKLRRIRDKSGTYYFRDRLLCDGKGRLAFVYPGVMSFYPDMMRDLVIDHDICRHAFDELEEALRDNADFTPSSFIFPPASYYRHDADIFSSGAYAQALVSTYSGCVALTRLLHSFGVSPEGVVGFAGGDLAAMMRSGAAGATTSRPDRVNMIRDIYRIVDKAVNHGGLPKMAMVTALLRTAGEIDELVRSFPPDKVMLAVDFSPRQKTFAIDEDYLLVALGAFAAAGVRTKKLELDRPFNTPLCASLVPAVRKFATTWMKHEPVCEIYSCATAARLVSGLKSERDDTAGRWAKCVRFEETIRKMHADGYRVFLEVGPRELMTAAIEDTLSGTEHAAIALNSIHRSGRLQLQHALAQLVALGASLDISNDLARRGARKVDFDAAISLEVRKDSEMRLSHVLPRMTLISRDTALSATHFLAEPKGRGVKAAQRAAAVAQQARRQRQFDFGAMNPLVSDADMLSQTPGIGVEISKLFKVSDFPFFSDFALGTSQISYSDPNLKGLLLLPIPIAAEIMAETASMVVPNRTLTRIEDFTSRRMVSFKDGQLTLFVRAERVASISPDEISVKVQLRDDAPNSAYTWPVMEAVFVLTEKPLLTEPLSVAALSKPRSVHWTGREIYPARLCSGRRLRGIRFVDAWSESGLDYQVVVPPLAGNAVFTRFPVWMVNPILFGIVVSGFALWRSHERFSGAFSLPFRMRRMTLPAKQPAEDTMLNCYLRLTGVTPKSQLCDIAITDGNGQQLVSISGWEELTERVPVEYCRLVMQPPLAYVTQSLGNDILGRPSTDVASAYITDVPYAMFERNEELWLRVISRIVLSSPERKELREMTGSAQRRTEWLFGRIAAKEAVRRFLHDFYQARWSDADVQIWANDSGKPTALGDWSDYLTTKLDIAIAHTAQFVVAVAAANARVGVDVESTARDLSGEFTTGVFTSEELELAAQSSNPSIAVIRFWCAKEAVSKALGTGIRYSPKEMNVVSYLSDNGRLVVRLDGAWLEAFKKFRGLDIEVFVKTVRDHALATCFIPMSLFNED